MKATKFLSARLSSAAGESHYSALGIADRAPIAAVKKAFYGRAKLLHPDAANGRLNPSDATAAFIKISLAFDFLSDPHRKSAYDADLLRKTRAMRPPEGGTSVRASGRPVKSPPSGTDEDPWTQVRSAWRAGFRSTGFESGPDDRGPSARTQSSDSGAQDMTHDDAALRGDPNRMFGGYAGIVARAERAGTRDSLWSALARARDGPAFLGGLSEYPYAFELEARNHPSASHDVLHMVVGSQHIGSVVGRGMGRLPAPDSGAPPTALPGTAPTVDSPASDGPDGAPTDRKPEPRGAGAGFALFSSSTSSEAASRGVALAGVYDTLEFWYQGSLLASAVLSGTGGGIWGGGSGEERLQLNPYAPLRSAGSGAPQRAGEDGDGDGDGGDGDGGDETRNYITIYRHLEDGSRGPPLAHILGARGFSGASFRRVVSCDLVNPHAKRRDPEPAAAAEAAGAGVTPTGDARPPDSDEDLSPPAAQAAATASPAPRGVFDDLRDFMRSVPALNGARPANVATGSGAGEPRSGGSSLSPYAALRAADDGQPGHVERYDPARYRGFATHVQYEAALYETIQHEYATGYWRRHTVRVMGREQREAAAAAGFAAVRGERSTQGSGRAAAADPAVAAAARAQSEAAAAGVSGDGYDPLQAHIDHVCGTGNKYRRSEPGARERVHGWRSDRETAGGARASNAVAAQDRWNQSRPWLSAGDGEDMPTFSAHHDHLATWEDAYRGAVGGPAAGGPDSGRKPHEPAGWQFSATATAGGHGRRNASTAFTSSSADHHWACPATGAAVAHDPAYVDPSFATHTLVSYRTPGVTHLRWMRNRDGSAEASATRVRLPDPSLWVWEPRSPAHCSTNTSFELARRARVEPALHPAVYVLTSAVLALESEWEAALQEQRQSAVATRARDALRRGWAAVVQRVPAWGTRGH